MVGVGELVVEELRGTVRIGAHRLVEGDVVTIDGGSGEVVVGQARAVPPAPCAELATLLEWADELAGAEGSVGASDVERLAGAHRALDAARV